MAITLWKKQYDFYVDKGREALLEAGIAYGKSMCASMWLFEQVQAYSKSKWFMAARDYKQLKTAVDEEFEFYLHDIYGLERNIHYNKTSGSPIVYEFKHNGAKIYGVGAHNYDTVFRAGNYSGCWGDEVDYWKPEAVRALRGRIRRVPERLRWTSSPDGYNHVYDDFYTNKIGTVYNATSYENKTLTTEYLSSLKKTYSPRLFEQEVLAKRLRINVGCVYDEFNREINVQPCRDKLKETDQLYFFTDYNIANYCGIYMFFDGEKVYAIGEEHLTYQGTRVMAEKIKAKYNDRHIFVCGDSAGNNKKDTAADKTNYQIFDEVLGVGTTRKVTNPLVQQRIIAANSNFYHKRLVIDPSCETLIKDLELLAWKENGKDIEKTIDLSHASDAFTYGAWYFLPIKKQNGPSRMVQL